MRLELRRLPVARAPRSERAQWRGETRHRVQTCPIRLSRLLGFTSCSFFLLSQHSVSAPHRTAVDPPPVTGIHVKYPANRARKLVSPWGLTNLTGLPTIQPYPPLLPQPAILPASSPITPSTLPPRTANHPNLGPGQVLRQKYGSKQRLEPLQVVYCTYYVPVRLPRSYHVRPTKLFS